MKTTVSTALSILLIHGFCFADTLILDQSIGTMPFATVDNFQINDAAATNPADFEFLIQNGDGLDYFPQPCNTGSMGQRMQCKAHNNLIAAKVLIDRPIELEIKLNGVVIVNRNSFPKEKGQFVYHARLSGQQMISVYQAGLPMTSTRIKIVKYGDGNATPIAGFAFTSLNNFFEPSLVSFSGLNSFDPDGVIVDYQWNFGDGSYGQGSMVNHIFESAGQYLITLTVTDNRGATASRSENIFIQADTSPPVLSNIQPASGSEITGNSILLSGESNESLSKVEYQVNGGAIEFADINPEDSLRFSSYIAFQGGGAKNILVRAYDYKGNFSEIQLSYNLNFNNPPVARISLISKSHETAPSMIWLDASGSSDLDQDALTYEWRFDDGSEPSYEKTPTHRFDNPGTYNVSLKVTDAKGATSLVSKSILLNPIVLPIDPAEIAPPLAQHIVQNKAEKFEFLYSMPDSPQKNVDNSKMDEERITPIHGKVFKSENEALAGVKITVVGHSEYGYTYSREDGEWDLAINGGGTITVEFEKLGFTKVQRPLNTEKLISRTAPDVFLSEVDVKGTEVQFNSTVPQVHEASLVQDASGVRKTQVLIPENTAAKLRMSDGTLMSVEKLTIRATEVTVGPNGIDRMPGPLPSRSAYTYCADFTADEALALNAESVEFSKPVPVYVDNFLNIPAGIPVPVGYFNSKIGAWEALSDGIVIKIIGVDGAGRAILDLEGQGTASGAEYLLAQGIENSELETIARRFQPGQSFWRVRLKHFSQVDMNLAGNPIAPPVNFADIEAGSPPTNGSGTSGATPVSVTAPPSAVAGVDKGEDPANRNQCGCEIDPRQQTVGEVLTLPGTDFNLNYNTSRAAGYSPVSAIKAKLFPQLQIAGSDIRGAEVTVEIAGKKVIQKFDTPILNSLFEYSWDGYDHLGRKVFESMDADLTITYLVDGFYRLPLRSLSVETSFNSYEHNINALVIPSRNLYQISRSYKVNLSSPFDRSRSINFRLFNGWSLSDYHSYDPLSRSLFTGNGKFFTAQKFVPVVKTIAGNGTIISSGNGQDAKLAGLKGPVGIAVDSAGNIFIADTDASEIRKIDKSGIITHVAGNGDVNDFRSNNEGAADMAGIGKPYQLEVNETGEIYFTDIQNALIRKIDREGVISVVAGSGLNGFSGDGGSAVSATMSAPSALTLTSDGSILFSDSGNNRLRKIDSTGMISTVVSNVPTPRSVISDSKGNIYFSSGTKIFLFRTDNTLTELAGNNGTDFGLYEELGDAKRVYILPGALALDINEKLFFFDLASTTIKTITPTSTVQTVAGFANSPGYNGEGLVARETRFSDIKSLRVDSDGSILVADYGNHRIRKIDNDLPDHFPAAISSIDGSEMYYFNAYGLHTATKRTDTGAIKYLFVHDEKNQLIQIKDAFEKTTVINRDSSGNLTSIVGPYGQVFNITLDQNNFLTKITDPINNTTEINYTSDGLISSFKKPEGQTTVYEYGSNGRLTKVTEPNGGFRTYVRNSDTNEVLVTSREGVQETFYYAASLQNKSILNAGMVVPGIGANGKIESISDGQSIIKQDNGTETTQLWSTDPRFSGHAGYISKIISKNTKYGNITYEANTSLSYVVLPDGNNFTKTQTSTDSLGHQEVTSFNSLSRTITSNSSLGLSSTMVVDENLKPSIVQIGTFSPIQYQYDSLGRVSTISQGNRTTAFNYDENGFLSRITDPENRITQFENDKIGRVLATISPDSQVTQFSYDKNSNLVGITPPESTIYQFVVNLIGQVTQFIAPDSPAKTYNYDYDGKLKSIVSESQNSTNITYWSPESLEANLPAFITSDLRIDFRYASTFGLPNPKYMGVSGNPYNEVGATDYQWGGGWLLSKTADNIGTITNNFNSAGKIINQTSNLGTINYSYNTDHFLVTAGDLTISRDNSTGFILQKSMGIFVEDISYNEYGEVSSKEYKKDGTLIYSEAYQRDKLGRIKTKTITKNGSIYKTMSYEYDLNGRLIRVFQNGVLKDEYTYDLKGNRLSRNANYSAQYDTQGRILNYTIDTSQHSFTYNADSTRITESYPGESVQFSISPLNPLREVRFSSGNTPNLFYSVDGEMKRIGRTFSDPIFGSITRHYWLYDGSGRLTVEIKKFEYTNRFIYASQSHSPDYMISDRNGLKKYFFIKDQLGSILKVIDETGNVLQELEYDEFGRVLVDTNPGFQPFGFAGGHYDPDTGLTRFGARDYNAETGRWLERDPILFDGGSSNLYEYVGNDPINRIDPSGLASICSTQLSNGLPFIQNGYLDSKNLEVLHQQIFYDNGFNTGYFNTGVEENTEEGGNYKNCENKHYDDKKMKSAVERAIATGRFTAGSYGNFTNNCQDFVDAVKYYYNNPNGK